ncbi:MAG: two-component system response regulator [Verrucomicrobiales bacterium]|nr:two-component system response regulator [Verrucomicrobiales bacterium]
MTGDYPILLVEDDSNDSLLLQRAFRRAALTNLLQVVTNSEEAVDYLLGEKHYQDRAIYPLPRLLILDLKLPGMSGLELLKWIRSEAKLKDLSVIILSSSRQTDDIDRAYELGATSYMAKPEGNFDGLAEMVKCLDLEKNKP